MFGFSRSDFSAARVHRTCFSLPHHAVFIWSRLCVVRWFGPTDSSGALLNVSSIADERPGAREQDSSEASPLPDQFLLLASLEFSHHFLFFIYLSDRSLVLHSRGYRSAAFRHTAVLPNTVPRHRCELSGVPHENPKWKDNTGGNFSNSAAKHNSQKSALTGRTLHEIGSSRTTLPV